MLISCREGIPLVVLLVFCAEGDNIPDAMTLLHYINDWLQLLKNNQVSQTYWMA